MNYVVDASVAIKWYIPDIHSAKAVAYLSLARDGGTVLKAPNLILPVSCIISSVTAV